MLDYGVYPPTTKWPEIVPEALMTEPTEAESKRTLNQLAEAFNAVAGEDDSTERSSCRVAEPIHLSVNPAR
jgi:glycine dehydrogenase subunit 2